MKKAVLLLFITFIGLRLAYAQSDWISYSIDNKLSVKVPGPPAKADEYSVIAVTKDSMVCVITKVDMQKAAGVDSAALAGLAASPGFSDQIKTGMLEKMQGFTLGDVKSGKWNGYYCYNVDGENASTKVKSFTFMIIIANYLYSFSAMFPETKDAKPKGDFFASIKLN